MRNWEGCWRIESCPWMRIRAGGSTHRRTIRILIQRLSGRALRRRESIETTFGQPRNSSGQSPEGCMGWALRCFSPGPLSWLTLQERRKRGERRLDLDLRNEASCSRSGSKPRRYLFSPWLQPQNLAVSPVQTPASAPPSVLTSITGTWSHVTTKW